MTLPHTLVWLKAYYRNPPVRITYCILCKCHSLGGNNPVMNLFLLCSAMYLYKLTKITPCFWLTDWRKHLLQCLPGFAYCSCASIDSRGLESVHLLQLKEYASWFSRGNSPESRTSVSYPHTLFLPWRKGKLWLETNATLNFWKQTSRSANLCTCM